MKTCHFTISKHIIKNIEDYHDYYNQRNNVRRFNQTIATLLKYVLEDTREISQKEIMEIEEFFRNKEHVLDEFLDMASITYQEDYSLRQYA